DRADEAARRRLHHQLRIYLLDDGVRRDAGLYHEQGRRAWLDAWIRPGPRSVQHPRQHHHARLGDDGAPARAVGAAGKGGADRPGAVPARAAQARAPGQHGALPRLRRCADDHLAELRRRRGVDLEVTSNLAVEADEVQMAGKPQGRTYTAEYKRKIGAQI